jgi:3-phenylpropionate/trans-cinnamate dioxygenase ferredoxin reductase component
VIEKEQEMDRYEYIIIGGGIASQRAVDGIRRADTEGSAALISAEPHVPYQRPPLSKDYLRGEEGLDEVYLQGEDYYVENSVELMTSTRVVALTPDDHRITLADGRHLGYGKLLLATGGRANSLPLPGADLPGVLTLRTIEDCHAIQELAKDGTKAVVFGASYIGSEVAASLTQMGVEVTMVYPEDRLLERLVPEVVSQALQEIYAERGVRMLAGIVADRLEGSDRLERVVLKDGTALEADLVVMGVGISLNTELAELAGLELTGPKKAIVVDENLRTSAPDIYAAGDIAAWPDRTFERRLRVEHWDVARAQGLRAGRNMAGDVRAYTTLPYFFSDLFEVSFELWGHFETWDQTLTRGEMGASGYAIYYFHEGRLTGVLSAGRPKGERKPMQSLVQARVRLEQVSDQLQDEETDLASLVD